MAVPKKKMSRSRTGKRMGGNGSYKAKNVNVMIDKDTGAYKLSHQISLDGYYNGKLVVNTTKKKKVAEEENKEQE